MAAHPHARGEHFCRSIANGLGNGSSPRTWGTRDIGKIPSYPARLIPTHVGNTRGVTDPVHGVPAHPHARGEHPASFKC